MTKKKIRQRPYQRIKTMLKDKDQGFWIFKRRLLRLKRQDSRGIEEKSQKRSAGGVPAHEKTTNESEKTTESGPA